MSSRRVVASRTETATGSVVVDVPGVGGTGNPPANINWALNVTAQSGTTPTLDVTIDWTHDGTTFIADPSGAIAFTQVGATTGTEQLAPVAVKAGQYRVTWTIAGGSPSYTFSLDAYEN